MYLISERYAVRVHTTVGIKQQNDVAPFSVQEIACKHLRSHFR